MSDLQKINTATCDIAREAGEFIRRELGKVQDKSIEEKSFNQLVSYVDRQAEELLVEKLHQLLPEATFLTEEKTVADSAGEWQWIIDPLDGTTNFLHGVPAFAVSIALKHQEEIVVGVVYEINRDECFYAWQKGGAWLNDSRVRVTKTSELAQALVATGFPTTDFDRLLQYQDALGYFMQHTRGVRRLGSAAVDLAYTACGRFDAFFEYNLNAWDVAAGVLIVQEAGGKVSDFRGSEDYLFGGEILASNSNLFPILLPYVQQSFYP